MSLAQVGDKHTLYQLRKEIAILKKVSYDANIVQFYGASTTEPAMLVMEFMEVTSSSPSPDTSSHTLALPRSLSVVNPPRHSLSRHGSDHLRACEICATIRACSHSLLKAQN